MKKISLLLLALLLVLSVVIACDSGSVPDTETTVGVTDAATTVGATEAVTDEPLTLEGEDGALITDKALHGWFDYGSALYLRDEFKVGSRQALALSMMKNEMEGFQYILASTVDYDGLRCEVSTLSDGQGNTLDGTVYIAQNIYVKRPEEDRGYHPDALLEQDNPYHGGTFNVVAGRSKTLYVRYLTDGNTVPGLYTGTLEIKQGDTVLLSGQVSLTVYDIYYDEKTECLSYFQYGALWDSLYSVPAGSPNMYDYPELMEVYCDFLVANRMSPFQLPYEDELLDERAAKYMDNPRVNTVLLRRYPKDGNYQSLAEQYRVATEKGWFDKIAFLSYDEPANEAHFQGLLTMVNRINEFFPTTNHVNAFGHDLPMDGKNTVERFAEFSTMHCVNVYPMYDMPHLYDTMLRLKEERGDTLFWYVCGTQQGNFINLLPSTESTAKRILFWQQYQHDIDGFHYWQVTYWKAYDDIWEEGYEDKRHKLLGVDAPPTGDGCLVFWDPITKEPISSLGFEAVRDGIEDFQLFRMAEAVLGKDTVLSYIARVTTSATEYITDATLLAEVKTELAAALVAATEQ